MPHPSTPDNGHTIYTAHLGHILYVDDPSKGRFWKYYENEST